MTGANGSQPPTQTLNITIKPKVRVKRVTFPARLANSNE